ncbi:hypothetical protein BGX34_002113 [Mortierella sp. NVP85]|nr:hypothetical protein BGX34_002113 [Mortierella sp. NVP85]
MASIVPVKNPPTPPLSPSPKTDTSHSSFSSPSSSFGSSSSSSSKAAKCDATALKSERSTSRFNLSKIFPPHYPRSEQNQEQPLPPPPPQENHARRPGHGFSFSKIHRPLRQGKLFGFLKSHYHTLHRQKAPKTPTDVSEPKTKANKTKHNGTKDIPARRSSARSLICFQYLCGKWRTNNNSAPADRAPGSQSTMFSDGLARIVPTALSAGLGDHYLSLPVGVAANQLHTLHSEDLSVTEFAKLAGITILPEDDDDEDNGTTSSQELAFSVNNDTEWSRRVGNGATMGSVGYTINSDRAALTTTSLANSRNSRKINIWEPEFWMLPACDGLSPRLMPSGFSSSSLPILSNRPNPRAPPSRASSLPVPSSPVDRTASDSALVSTTGAPLTHEPSAFEGSSEAKKSGHGRSSSYSPPGSPGLRRVDQASKDAEVSRDLRRSSYTSFTAVAIELDNNHGSISEAAESSTNDLIAPPSPTRDLTTPPSPTRDLTTPPSPTRMETSNPSEQGPTALPQQSHAHSVALHALQAPRSRNSLGGTPYRSRSNLRARGPHVVRTRSPSPSPLSRQIELSDSEGVESPSEEKQDFDLRQASSGTEADPMCLTPSGSTAMMTPLASQSPSMNNGIMYQHMTQSMPLLLPPQHPLDTRDLTVSMPSSPSAFSTPSCSSASSSPSSTPRGPPNSCPARMFTPGTKVGRFTLVQEQCAKHTDVLKVQQEHQLELFAPRRASMGDLLHNGGWQRARRVGAAPLELSNSPLPMTPEENVVVFQRKRTRRHLPPIHV